MNAELRHLAQTAWPEERKALAESADRFLNDTFLFNDPWDMEQCRIPVEFSGPIDWEYRPADDPEWTYMLARQSYVLLLARQAVLTGDKKYAGKIAYFIEDFIDHVPLTDAARALTWRTLDAGIRAANWLSAWELLDQCGMAPTRILDKMKESLRVHINYLLEEDTPFCRLSNWGIIGNSGMYQAAIFLGDEAAMLETEKRVADEVSIQVDPDGWHWEQSPMYHAEVLVGLLRIVRLARRAGRELPAIIPETAHAMCLAVARSAKPDHHQFMQSDSDDTDVRDLLTQGAILFLDPALKFHGNSTPDFESLFWINESELAAFCALEAKPLPLLSSHEHSGNFYLRTGWTETDSCLRLHSGYMGSGHGHADQLHVDLCALGKDVLVDSGRYTYVDKPIRLQLKDAPAHNTFTLDGRSFTDCTETWAYGEISLPLRGGAYSRNGWSFAEAGHLGYLRLKDPAVCRRYAIQAGPCIAFVMDVVNGRGPHSCEGFFHFKKEALRLESDRAVYDADGVVTEVFYPGRQAKAETAPVSPHYNTLYDSSVLLLSSTHEGSFSVPTVFVSQTGKAAGASVEELPVTHVKSGRVLNAREARAFRVSAFGDHWDILFCFEDSAGDYDLLAAGDVNGHGRVIASHGGIQTTLAW